jgi:electron transport complex protein RnfE
LLGQWAQGLSLSLGPDFHGVLLAILPPGAFIGLGLLIALKNIVDKRLQQRHAERARTAHSPFHPST